MKKIDKPFLISFLLLLITGFTVFVSASLGIFASNQAKFTSIMFNQVFLGLVAGLVACFVFSLINYRLYRKFALYIFIISCLATVAVFIPGVGVTHGGATRWIYLFGFSFQPLELLKLGFIIYLAAWFSGIKDKVQTLSWGYVPLLVVTGIVGGILLMQPDTDSFIILAATGLIMFLVAGGKWRYIFVSAILGVICLSVLIFSRPYLLNRFQTFFDPSANGLSSSYQIQQSLIAIGSGEIFGRGLGQSIQKFKFLPESIGDAIFPVAAEELGFVGSVFILVLFMFFASRGLKLAKQAPDVFGGLLVVGIVILILIQSFLNIASMTGVIPLSGSPLIFFSQGGTALFFTLVGIGIILNISKQRKNK